MVGPGPQEARNLVEQVVGQVQGMLPEGLELAATIARYEPGMNVRSLVDPSRDGRAGARARRTRRVQAVRIAPSQVRAPVAPPRDASVRPPALSRAPRERPPGARRSSIVALVLGLVARRDAGLYLWRRPHASARRRAPTRRPRASAVAVRRTRARAAALLDARRPAVAA